MNIECATRDGEVVRMSGKAWQIYVIHSDAKFCKVGIAISAKSRLATLQTASPYRLTLGFAAVVGENGRQLERHVHQALATHQVQGEWFSVGVYMAAASIRRVAANLGFTLSPVSEYRRVKTRPNPKLEPDEGVSFPGLVGKFSRVGWTPPLDITTEQNADVGRFLSAVFKRRF